MPINEFSSSFGSSIPTKFHPIQISQRSAYAQEQSLKILGLILLKMVLNVVWIPYQNR